ncbi:protein HYPER-SENSITIVITY-RELATED 4-like [Salvia splendens]|uniref:protein HYPER-SENSITIVITY-RELATED 4-like n=1 Tax=Salvia splendens TaxID=180675 RepID=UPI001C26E0EA|nr:protein HYPER-SENSITIVITY-RELATED 4-like [Salvia splendens]
MSSSESKSNHLATANSILSAAGSIAASIMVVRGVAQDLIPREFQDYLFSGLRSFAARFSNHLTVVIDEFDGLGANEFYFAAAAYLGPKVTPNTRRLKISKPERENHINITMERGEEITDSFRGQEFKWVWICRKIETSSQNFYNPRDMNSTLRSEVRSFELTFHKKNRGLVLDSYLPFITQEAKLKKQEKKTIKIFTVDYENLYHLNNMWNPVTLDHPAKFETLAMDSQQKEMILGDLERFLRRREYYRKVGKAWKRGYLLYGPPGTGKSSLIAAMANYLKFDVYDLELTELRRNSDLKKLLLSTANQSILVVEDIDCTIDFQEKLATRAVISAPPFQPPEDNKVTLSGLLNFVDGLWSSCGDERIIIFTTNYIERLDPALLRPGRMDVHINMSYCSPCGFKLLASNYLDIKDHPMFEEIEDLLPNARATPAEVAEQLLKDDQPHDALQGLIDFLHEKTRQNVEVEVESAQQQEEV